MTDRKIIIRFTTDKNGRGLAHYWGRAHRWLPISIEVAELKLALGEAVPATPEGMKRPLGFYKV